MLKQNLANVHSYDQRYGIWQAEKTKKDKDGFSKQRFKVKMAYLAHDIQLFTQMPSKLWLNPFLQRAQCKDIISVLFYLSMQACYFWSNRGKVHKYHSWYLSSFYIVYWHRIRYVKYTLCTIIRCKMISKDIFWLRKKSKLNVALK